MIARSQSGESTAADPDQSRIVRLRDDLPDTFRAFDPIAVPALVGLGVPPFPGSHQSPTGGQGLSSQSRLAGRREGWSDYNIRSVPFLPVPFCPLSARPVPFLPVLIPSIPFLPVLFLACHLTTTANAI